MNELMDKFQTLDAEIVTKIICIKDQQKRKQLMELRLKLAEVINMLALICS